MNADRMAVAFSRILRGAGLPVPMGSVLAFVDALGLVGIDRRDSVYWAGRATLVRHPEDIGLYDKAFAAFWQSVAEVVLEVDVEELQIAMDEDSGDDSDDDAARSPDDTPLALRFSTVETLRDKDFAAYTDDESITVSTSPAAIPA